LSQRWVEFAKKCVVDLISKGKTKEEAIQKCAEKLLKEGILQGGNIKGKLRRELLEKIKHVIKEEVE